MKYLFLFIFLCSSPSLLADNYEPKDVTELQAQYNLLIDLRNEESISEAIFEEKTIYLKQLAIKKFQVDIEGLELQQIVPAQRIDWIGSAFYVISALLLLAILGPLLSLILRPIVKLVKRIIDHKMVKIILIAIAHFIKKTWEGLAYISLFLMLYFLHNEYAVLVASFALGSLISYSIYSRKGKERAVLYGTIGSWVLTILWGLIAYFYNNGFVGFLAVGSFISSIGFSFYMDSSLIMFDFKKNNAPFVLRLTLLTFVLTLLSWLIFYTNYITVLSALKPHLRVFEVGMTSLIPMLAFLGLFYINYIYTFQKDPIKKIVLESIALIAALGVLVIALVYGIGSMFWIGLLFTIWSSFDKFYWLVYKNVNFIWTGLILAALLAGAGYFIKTNLPMIMEHLKFLNL
jgi:MFS family permease